MLGAICFDPKVFGSIWANAHGMEMDPEKRKEVNMVRLMGTAFVFTIMITTIIAKVCLMACGGGDACLYSLSIGSLLNYFSIIFKQKILCD